MINFQRALFVRPALAKAFGRLYRKKHGVSLPKGFYNEKSNRIVMTVRDPKMFLHELGHKIREKGLRRKGFDYNKHTNIEESLANRYRGRSILRFKDFLTKMLGQNKYRRIRKSTSYNLQTPIGKRVKAVS